MNNRKIKPVKLDPNELVSEARRVSGAQSLRAFAETYLPHHFRALPGAMHLDLFRELERFGTEKSLRLAVAAPRNHAKSTIVSLMFVLHCVCYARHGFILLVSDTAGQAEDLLAQVRHELEQNERLIADFPEVCEPKDGGRSGTAKGPRSAGLRGRWRKDDIVTKGTERFPGGIRVMALGAEQQVRGRRNRSDRPSLIVCDDLENADLVRSREQRDNRANWFHGTLMKSGSVEAAAVVVGTVLHHDSLLARLLDPVRCPGWITKRYKSVIEWADRGDLWEKWESIYNHQEEWEGRSGPDPANEYFRANEKEMLRGTEVLWPAQMGYLQLMQTRVRDGRVAFATEMQNEPTDPEARVFRDEDFHFWDGPDSNIADGHALVNSLDGYVRIVGACDPSLGRNRGAGGRGDYTAIVTLACHSRTNDLYVLHTDIRRLRPDEILEAIIESHRIWGYSSFGVEVVQFQQMLKDELEKRARGCGNHLHVREIRPTGDKVARIQNILPLMTSGTLKFSRRQTMLLEQMKLFPGGHDDGPDALEMAVKMAQSGEVRPLRFMGGAMG